MATECPIRMIESTDRWSIPKKSTRYKSSSGKLLFEEIGLLFRNPVKDIMPSRSESAPPSMEGSMAAMRNIPSFQERSLNHDEICEGLSSLNLENERLSNTVGSYQFSMGSLPVHAEESQDDSSSVRSGSIIVEGATVLGSLSTPFSKKEDSCCSSSPSHDQNNSYSCNSRQGAFAYGSDSHVNNISVDTNNSCSDNMSQISSLDGSRNIAAWPYVTNSESHDLSKEGQSSPQNKMLPHGVSPQQAKPSEVQGTNVHPGVTSAFGSFNQLRNASSGVPMENIQPLLHASGYTPPLYADAAAYMASSSTFYPYMQPAGYFAPMYLGGYNLNPAVYPSGYPHQGVAPFALGGNSFPNSGVSTGVNAHAYDLQNLHRYHGQVGAHLNPHPSMQYFQPTLRHPYSYYIHFGHQASSDSTAMNQNNSFNARRPSDLGAYKSPQLADTSYGNASQRRRNPPSHYNSESQKHADSRGQNLAAFAKPVSGNNFSGERHNMSHNHSSDGSRNKTTEQVWNPSNVYIFLEELKSGKGQRFELPDIAGHIVDFSVDQHGSRFIQQKLETCSIEEKESVLKEVLPHASKLITDVFGNYVIQKLFEYGSQYQRKYLANQLEGEILTLSMQMYGCRVIQKALDVIDLEEKTKLVRELEGHVMKCVYDQNGNHVIQKCIECIPTENIHFVISSFRGHVEELSKHPYGCRVIQRILERCSDGRETQFIVDEILDSVYSLSQDQYGNYVTQVLVKGKPCERKEIVEKLAGSVVQLSQHKFASNVIEKCIEFSDSSMRELLIQNIVGHGAQTDNLLIMMKDQFANYVVQKILEKCSSEQRNLLLAMIRNHLTTLKKYTYGKHIVARFERLCGEDGS